jgi:hypothetical protein
VDVMGCADADATQNWIKNPYRPALGFRAAEWGAFVGHVPNEAFDRR